MKESDEQIIWKFLDGDCNEEERNQVESLLQNRPNLLGDFEMRRILHTELEHLELESPPLDFTSKVMTIIPEPKPISAIQPLISPLWKKSGIVACVVFFSVSVFLLYSYSSIKTEPILLDKISDFNALFYSMIYSIPTSTYELIGLVVLALSGLILLDLFLNRKFQKRALSV